MIDREALSNSSNHKLTELAKEAGISTEELKAITIEKGAPGLIDRLLELQESGEWTPSGTAILPPSETTPAPAKKRGRKKTVKKGDEDMKIQVSNDVDPWEQEEKPQFSDTPPKAKPEQIVKVIDKPAETPGDIVDKMDEKLAVRFERLQGQVNRIQEAQQENSRRIIEMGEIVSKIMPQLEELQKTASRALKGVTTLYKKLNS